MEEKTVEKNLHALDDAVEKINAIRETAARPDGDISIFCIVSDEDTGKTAVTIYGTAYEIATSIAGAYRNDKESGINTLKMTLMLLSLGE